MIRVKIAAWLLRTTGAKVEYGVRRVSEKQIRGKGTTILVTSKLKAAQKKYRDTRTISTNALTITITAIIAARQGTSEPTTEEERSENNNEPV